MFFYGNLPRRKQDSASASDGPGRIACCVWRAGPSEPGKHEEIWDVLQECGLHHVPWSLVNFQQNLRLLRIHINSSKSASWHALSLENWRKLKIRVDQSHPCTQGPSYLKRTTLGIPVNLGKMSPQCKAAVKNQEHCGGCVNKGVGSNTESPGAWQINQCWEAV